MVEGNSQGSTITHLESSTAIWSQQIHDRIQAEVKGCTQTKAVRHRTICKLVTSPNRPESSTLGERWVPTGMRNVGRRQAAARTVDRTDQGEEETLDLKRDYFSYTSC